MGQMFLSFPEFTYHNKEWLYHSYIEEQETLYDIARKVGVSYSTIHYYLKKLDIPIRTRSEAGHLCRANHIDLSPEALEFLDGELLGDGSLNSRSRFSAYYTHSSKYLEYLIWLSALFKNWGIEIVGSIIKRKGGWGTTVFDLTTRTYEEFRILYERWYPGGRKIVPKDISLTPLTLRQTYLGDGSLRFSGKRPSIILCTQGFPRDDVVFLVEKLNSLGLKSALQPSKNTIRISAFSTPEFLSYIGPCPPEIESIYGYKWNYQNNRVRKHD